ncbi:MAG: hypothetical protein M3Y85_08980, partial [Bacteroidota bacterium]|nr:hypothetical protein [Bacteroidota bacterium]
RDEGPRRILNIAACGVLLLMRLPKFYDVFIKRSYAIRIPLSNIKSVTLTEDTYGLQIYATLYLKNGRYKKIAFRKLEDQSTPFEVAVSQYISQSQFA